MRRCAAPAGNGRFPALATTVVLLVLAAGCSGGGGRPAPAPGKAAPGAPVVVLAGRGADAWVRLLRAAGGAARIGTLDELLARPGAIVPGGVPLVGNQRQRLRAWVDGGGRLVTAHEGLLDALGFRRAASQRVTAVSADGLAAAATWPAPAPVRPVEAGPGLTGFTAVARAQGGDAVVAAEAHRGLGGVLALAIDPVAAGREGWELLPTVGHRALAWTGAPAGPQRTGVEIYLDPGGLHGQLKGDPESLADRLKDVRAVHVAGWNFGFKDPAADYDYAALIDALHRRGVLVYAWLEPPFVNQALWDDHPECRERTATGREAVVDWRHLLALEDPGCFGLAWSAWSGLLNRFDWDGVNVAELYFEPDVNHENFTPFHPSALARFGKDPVADPAAFLAFRRDLVADLNRQVLVALNGLPRAKELDFELTVIDDTLDPKLATAVGSDLSLLAKVAKDGGASLQVEDPYTTQAQSPLRYERLGTRVAGLAPAGQAFIDLTVADRPAGRPTALMTGAELDLAVMAATARTGRVGVYSAGTVAPGDLSNLPAAAAGTVTTLDTGIKTSWTVTVHAPGGAADGRLSLDGKPWPAGPGLAVVPAGEHRVEWATGAPVGPSLLRFTAEIGTAEVRPDALAFSYDSRPRPLVVVDRRPTGVRVDDADAPLTVVAGPGGGFAVRLPGGTHRVSLSFV